MISDLETTLPAQLHHRNYTLIYAPTQLQRPSMPPGFEHRWQHAHAQIMDIAEQCSALADNGLTVYRGIADTDDFQVHQHVRAANLQSLMETAPTPERVTLAPVLQTVFDRYFINKATGKQPANGEIILILIDNEPMDRFAIAKQIVATSHQLDHNDELGIGWIQVGDDCLTEGFLVTLDDHLQALGAKLDIVDHKPIHQITSDDLAGFLMDVLRD